ncbi:MAG: SUMF1/EgtB/PvdO family nonheme iron enzyme [Candidatus Omnitrophota bacterium]
MKKNGIIWWVMLSVLVVVLSACTQEVTRGVQLNKIQNNAGKRIAICIGINEYEDSTIGRLKKARNDAKQLGKVLMENGQFDAVYVMTDDQEPRKEDYPKLINIKRRMDLLKGLINSQALVIFSFSGHGISNSRNEGFFLVADSYRNDQAFENTLKVSEIVQWLKEIGIKKSLLLLDACRENVIEGSRAVNLNMMPEERFSQAELGAVCYATKPGWFSYEDSDYGVFTKYIIKGLGGKADKEVSGNGDGIISFSELSAYVEENVTSWALRESKYQKPYTQLLGEKFGDIALSAYVKTDDKPADVKAMESKARRVYKNNKGYWEADFGDGIIMVYIPAGEFIMGSDDNDKDAEPDEKPSQKVFLDGYWLGKTEVTVKQFRVFVNETKYVTEGVAKGEEGKDIYWKNPGFQQRDDHPVVCMTWGDANAYCQWLSKKMGVSFTLPTEAQWEKGARGIDGRKYPWGNHAPHANGTWYSNYDSDDDKDDEDGFNCTSPVGFYPQGASSYGLMDMAGNVSEWCSGWYDKNYYRSMPLKNPTGPATGEGLIFRGDGWLDPARFGYVRSAKRFCFGGVWLTCIGFRLSIGQQGGSDPGGS